MIEVRAQQTEKRAEKERQLSLQRKQEVELQRRQKQRSSYDKRKSNGKQPIPIKKRMSC